MWQRGKECGKVWQRCGKGVAREAKVRQRAQGCGKVLKCARGKAWQGCGNCVAKRQGVAKGVAGGGADLVNSC